jgi:hypothetical protein
MKLYFRGNKLIEIIIYSLAVSIGIVILLITGYSFWYVLPYILLEGVMLYFLLKFHYVVENHLIKIKYAFYTCKVIPIRSIHKIIIQDKQKGEPENSPHRLEIYYGLNKKQVIQPVETVSFIENIEREKPGIEIM